MRRASGALFIALGAACALVAAGCGRPVKIDAAQAREPASRADGQHSSKQLSWVKDDLGHVVMLPAAPRRVVSLSPNLTEVVFFLGAGDRLVGRTDFCDYPPEAIAVPSVGAIVMPS
ncbi:MAG: cobalamin-binding protein, partial [Armatimonadota bacterium]